MPVVMIFLNVLNLVAKITVVSLIVIESCSNAKKVSSTVYTVTLKHALGCPSITVISIFEPFIRQGP